MSRLKKKVANRNRLVLTVLGFIGLFLGCSRNAPPPESRPQANDQNAVAPTQPADMGRPGAPAETTAEVQAVIAAAQAAAKTQNYSNVVQRFDTLRSSGRLTGDQLAQIQDAEAQMMRRLAAKAAAGDQNALHQFRQISDRPRGSP